MMPDYLSNAKRVYQGVRFDIHAVELPGEDGRVVRREVLIHPGAVVILPMLGPDHVVLIQNQRFAVGKTLWELPAGTLEPGEPIDLCAARELAEETGYRAGRLEKLTSFYASPGIINEEMHAYLGTELTRVGQDLDESERITVHTMPWKRAMEMARNGEIRDGKTLATLLYYDRFIRASRSDQP